MTINSHIIEQRRRLLGPQYPTFYRDPIQIVKGKDVWLWDEKGKKYLDCYNNVAHVGHCHPKVVEAIASQAATLNTHTRYLHTNIIDYSEKLLQTFDGADRSIVFTCTGSEANDVALRMAQAVTGKRGFISSTHTYHGNTTAVAALSKNKRASFDAHQHIRHFLAPDSLRPEGGSITDLSHIMAQQAEQAILDLEKSAGFAGVILCPFFANEGFPDVPKGFLQPLVQVVKKYGGIIIADEVQPGFGRLGSHMWAHHRIGFSPDIITLGKPMANGHPVAATVTHASIVAHFRKAFRYFNTFAGNPVSCSAAMATLQVLEEENLQKNALKVGDYCKVGLQRLAKNYPCIGDVRGTGLFFGSEIVKNDRNTPDPERADHIVNTLRHNGILLSRHGLYSNVLKIRPPMTFTTDHADILLQELAHVLAQC